MQSVEHDASLVELQAVDLSQQSIIKNDSVGAAEGLRLRRNKLLGSSSMVLIVLGIVGFIPAYWVYFAEGKWYFDAIGRANFPDVKIAEKRFGMWWHVLLDVHASTCVVWTCMAIAQVTTGATGVPGDARKAWHRRMGNYAAGACVLVTLQAAFLQLLKPWNIQYIEIMTVGAMISGNLYMGITHARNKRYAEHKSAMTWTCAWTGAPGMVRLVVYVARALGDWRCRHDELGFYSWGVAMLMLVTLVPIIAILGEIRTKTFLVNGLGFAVALSGSAIGAWETWNNGDWCSDE